MEIAGDVAVKALIQLDPMQPGVLKRTSVVIAKLKINIKHHIPGHCLLASLKNRPNRVNE